MQEYFIFSFVVVAMLVPVWFNQIKPKLWFMSARTRSEAQTLTEIVFCTGLKPFFKTIKPAC